MYANVVFCYIVTCHCALWVACPGPAIVSMQNLICITSLSLLSSLPFVYLQTKEVFSSILLC